MNTLSKIPHRIAQGMCPINGLRDLIHWHTGRDWSNEFLWGLGQGGGFAYLRFNFADPPRQVFWGIATPRQHKYLGVLLGVNFTEIENRSFKFTWEKARNAIGAGTPPILGPLDMYYLHYYEGIYKQQHIPIHYVLLMDYDQDNAYVLDTDQQNIQVIPLADLEQAWDVNVPGMGKRNRLVIFEIPSEIDATERLIRKSILDMSRTMLEPPVNMLGIPAMKKVAREIPGWFEELGEESAEKCLLQIREYLNSPPDLSGNHLTAGRDRYIEFLEQAGELGKYDFSDAIVHFQNVVNIIPDLAYAILNKDLADAASRFDFIAKEETTAFLSLRNQVGER